jgi:5-methylcytosine-specific restriction endonuclease McrA
MPSVCCGLIIGRLRKAGNKVEKYHEKETPRDREYIDAYLEMGSQTKAANKCGVSRETIARAVRRAGIPLNGRKYNGKNQPQSKISDNELKSELKYMNCVEIAQKHKMSAERVYRRAKKLGLIVNAVGGGGHYRRRQKNYGKAINYDESVTLKQVRIKYKNICQICGKPIDATAIENGHIKRLYPTIDHIIPLSKGGTHTWDNVQLAHMMCNSGKRDKTNYTVKREEVWT